MFKPGIIDPRPAEARKRAKVLVVRDLKDFARWGLHLSDIEHDSLMANNPDTLGHPDQQLRSKYWKDYTTSMASAPHKVQGKI